MKILEVYANFLPRVGGVEMHLYGLCKCLIERGHEPIVLTWGPSVPSFEIIDEIRVHRFWMPSLFYVTRYPEIFYLCLQIICLARRYNVNMIHAHNYLYGLASAIAGGFLRIPVAVTFHDPMWFWPHRQLPAYISPIELILKKFPLNFVSAIICNSRFTCREIVKQGFPRSKLNVIYNWVTPLPRCGTNLNESLKKFNLVEKHFILSVARLDKLKGFPMLIHAFRLLINKGHNLDLVIVGEGPDKELLMKYSQKLGLEHKVHWLGRVHHKDLACLYEGCRLFAHPSYLEGLGLVLIEAMSFGKPVVSTNVGGTPEVIEDGKNGILVDPKPSDLASGIEKLLLNPHLEEAFAKRSREIVSEKFSVNNCHAAIDLLEEISKIRQ